MPLSNALLLSEDIFCIVHLPFLPSGLRWDSDVHQGGDIAQTHISSYSKAAHSTSCNKI